MTDPAENLEAIFPKKLKPLFQPMRYKILYGGRGGTKSWGVARALLTEGAEKPLRILCARELQKSIKDSVHRLLSDQITVLGMKSFYTIQQASIKGRNGTEFFFEGLRHNSSQIKSYEGADRVWVEEAATVSKASWNYLIPTIRKAGSEIWVTFNPELEEDETYQRFIIDPPTNSWVIKLNWRDNRWFSDELRQEKDDLERKDFVAYQNVWEGHCKQSVEGAIYETEMQEVAEEGRIRSVPYDRTKPVNTFWDLGYSDSTSIWFIQKMGFEYHMVDFYQNSHQRIHHYLEVLQSRGYIYGTHHLPHDARAESLGSERTIEELLRQHGLQIIIVPKLSLIDGLSATRAVFPACYFDKERCADGLQALRRYRYNVNADTGVESRLPIHDVNSHAADALRYFATAPNVMWDTYVESKGHGKADKVDSEFDPFEDV